MDKKAVVFAAALALAGLNAGIAEARPGSGGRSFSGGHSSSGGSSSAGARSFSGSSGSAGARSFSGASSVPGPRPYVNGRGYSGGSGYPAGSSNWGGHSYPGGYSNWHGYPYRRYAGGVLFVGAPFYAAPSYYYPAPAYYAPAPEYLEQPQGQYQDDTQAFWYYCAPLRQYYPQVQQCPSGWQRVPPQPPPG